MERSSANGTRLTAESFIGAIDRAGQAKGSVRLGENTHYQLSKDGTKVYFSKSRSAFRDLMFRLSCALGKLFGQDLQAKYGAIANEERQLKAHKQFDSIVYGTASPLESSGEASKRLTSLVILAEHKDLLEAAASKAVKTQATEESNRLQETEAATRKEEQTRNPFDPEFSTEPHEHSIGQSDPPPTMTLGDDRVSKLDDPDPDTDTDTDITASLQPEAKDESGSQSVAGAAVVQKMDDLMQKLNALEKDLDSGTERQEPVQPDLQEQNPQLKQPDAAATSNAGAEEKK